MTECATPTPFSRSVVETLHTVIAPGKRARLSPFVEAAQFQVLFGRRPNPVSRNRDARNILQDHQQDVEDLAHCWVEFIDGGKLFSPSIYGEDFLRSYLAYYLTTNVCKLQLTLLELVRQSRLSGCLTVLDIGVGTGTTAVAVLDFLVAWAHICTLYGAAFPIRSVQLTGIDVNPNCLRFSQQVVLAYAEVLAERSKGIMEGRTGASILKQAEEWARQAGWTLCDLDEQAPPVPVGQNLLVASNVLNELHEIGVQNLQTAIRSLSPGGIAVIIEPGDKSSTQRLNRWRRRFLQVVEGLSTIAPCGPEYGREQPWQCDQCWNARRESLHQTTLYGQFRRAAARVRPDPRSFDEFENDLLSWSYTCLLRSEREPSQPPCRALETESGGISTAVMRCIGSFSRSEPVARPPDESHSLPDENWIEYIKLCPGIAPEDPEGVYVERKPGFVYPELAHGQQVIVDGVSVLRRGDGVLKLIPNKTSRLCPRQSLLSVPQTFLPDYSAPVRQVIDEVAYRLFGFPAMYELQHKILRRVLTGDHILAIAATGGGKSECFILPAMLLPGVTIVVSPLKALMQDQYEQRISKRYGLDHLTTFINGDVPFRQRQTRLKRLERGWYKLAYFTPEQLERNYVLHSLQRTNANVGIRYLALDEAHCISQWGHDFRPSYLNLVRRLRDWGVDPVRIALTATASPNVRLDVCEELDLDPKPLEEGGDVYVYSSNRPELNLIVRVVPDTLTKSNDILDDLAQLLQENEHDQYPGAAIVFMPHTGGNPEFVDRYQPEEIPQSSQLGRLSAGVTRFASYAERRLQRRVAIYHSKIEAGSPVDDDIQDSEHPPFGNLSSRRQWSEQVAFIENRREIMVATKGFGMGIDKPNIRLIIHRTPTANLEAYAQEAGRAGRDGELADVILYYSPDSPEELDKRGRQHHIPSDYEIQEFFLAEKYIRQEDVIVMRAFLKTVDRQIGDCLYFTNDEAVAFYDSCQWRPGLTNLDSPYTWPEFPRREPTGFESAEHEAILNRGHIYQKKTAYVDRILKVLYRIRPNLEAGKRLAFLERVQDQGARLVKPQLRHTEAILQSNAYFGQILRGKGLTATDLKRWVKEGATRDLLSFARYLDLSLTETVAMFWDMRNADGYFRPSDGYWQPKLIDFRAIVAPRYGPAEGKDSLTAWRDYAGARTQAHGHERAENAGRDTPTLEDWFGWEQLSRSVGWEVLPGPAFKLDEPFDEYLAAFMELHNERETNDRGAYRRLLTDYVGVDEDGKLQPSESHDCLRSVLLGYLQTYEVVAGGNCFSCSRCVRGGEFEQDIEKRKSVVVCLGKAVSDLLRGLEADAHEIPSPDETEEFLRTAEAEQRAGRSLLSYLVGWTGRLLDDTPGHQTALWLRLIGMARGLIPMQPHEFVSDARQLVKSCSQVSLEQVWTVLETARELVPDTLELHLIQAIVCHRLSEPEQEREMLQHILDQDRASRQLRHQAHAALSRLHAPDGSLSASDIYALHTLQAARTATDPSEKIEYYLPLIQEWDWSQVAAELQWLGKLGRADTIPSKLLELWLQLNPGNESVSHVSQFLEQGAQYKQWPPSSVGGLLQQVPHRMLVERFPRLAGSLLSRWAEGAEPLPPRFAELAIVLGSKEGALPDEVARRCGQILFERAPGATADVIRERHLTDSAANKRLLVALSSRYAPASLSALLRYLHWFPPELLLAHAPGVALRLLETAASRSRQIGAMTDGQLRLRQDLGALADTLLLRKDQREAVHRYWLKLCELWPEETLLHMRHCLEIEPPAADLAEGCLDLWLRQDHTDLDDLIASVGTGGLAAGSDRIDRVVELVGLLNEMTTESDISTTRDALRYRHFHAIKTVFGPETDIRRADMAAALIGHLRKSLTPNWRSPVALLVEVLGYARRSAEAKELAQDYDNLRIGPKRESVERFLRRVNKPSRAQPEAEADYRRVIEIVTRDWICCQPRR